MITRVYLQDRILIVDLGTGEIKHELHPSADYENWKHYRKAGRDLLGDFKAHLSSMKPIIWPK